MKIFLTIAFFILAVVSQLTLWPRLVIFGAAPNFILAVVLFLAIFRGAEYFLAVILLGIITDILGGKFFGVASASFLFVFLFIGWFAKQVFVKNNWFSWLALSSLGVLAYQIIWFLFLRLGLVFNLYEPSAAGNLKEFIFGVLPAGFLMNSILALASFYFLKLIFKKTDERFV